MAYRDSSASNKRLIRYGVVAVVGAVILGAAFVLHDRNGTAAPDKPAGVAAASPSAPTPAAKTPAPQDAAASGDPVVPTDAQSDEVRRLVADARREADAGDFTAANASLNKADKVIPDLPETDQARSDIAAMATPEGQLATQLTRARLAIEQNDSAAAEKALAAAENLKPQAPEIAELRQALQSAQQKETHHKEHVDTLLAKMREAIARHDLAAADSALNEAARIDIGDPSIQRARVELNRAQNSAQAPDGQDSARIVSPTQTLLGVKH